MQSNNAMLLIFGLIFLTLAVVTPIVQTTFSEQATQYDTDSLEQDVISGDVTSTNWITIFITIFFWVVEAPWWLNLPILMMRLIFYVIIYDKIRGIG